MTQSPDTAEAARVTGAGIHLGDTVSLVIFDMDGVIADTAGGHKSAWREYMSRFNRTFTEEEFRSIFGTGNKELCRILFPDRDLSDDDIFRIGNVKEALFREKARGLLSTYPGFHRFLDLCDERNIPMVVGSSACRENVDFVLEELGIAHRFVATVSADDVENAKPAPDIFLKAAELGGSTPSESLVLEDSMMGIRAAGNAGMRVAGLATTHDSDELIGTDIIAGDFHELITLIS